MVKIALNCVNVSMAENVTRLTEDAFVPRVGQEICVTKVRFYNITEIFNKPNFF